ncbi:hypothetical protein I5481_21020 [Citrobacter freundii]|nr:hypothetical protein [Citrobacter freundii]
MRRVMCRTAAGLLAGGLLLPVIAGAATSGTATIQVTINNPSPTCKLALNGQSTLNYALGTMSPGSRMTHQPFVVQVECLNGAVKTAITAKPGPGNAVLNGDDSVRMQVAGTASVDSNSPQLWLQTDDGKRVKLTGQESDAFCTKVETSATMPNVCRLTPVTDIPAQSPSGNFGATMLIEVVYPQ